MSEYLWVEKYRPKKISECILSEDIKKTFAELGDDVKNKISHRALATVQFLKLLERA